MSTPIPYTIQKGDTLGKIAEKLKINNWKDLQVYHNNNCPLNEQIGTNLKVDHILYTPPQDEIDEMNGTSKEKAKPEPEKKEEKTQDEKPKEEKKKEEKKEDSKSEHDGKYYVVHGGTCVCDKAEDPTKEAELQVTTHQKMIYNDQSKKFAATEDDKEFKPPVATFGKCTLKPSSSGNQPCALSPAPKWDKPYDKTKVMGKCVLTQISELKCMVGGKITVKKHGQTDATTSEHAQNTNPAEMAHANPGVKKTITKAEYPSVDYITIESIENRAKFKPVKSKEGKSVEKIYVRPEENCSFTANVNKGNKSLASWVIYEGFDAKSDQKLLTKEQVGTTFSNSFPVVGNFRVEGYGKPKKSEFENGKYDKNDPDCSIDITVAINKLDENKLELHGEDFSAKIKEEVRLRKDFPAAFKAKFLMTPTPDELSRLEMFVTDEAGNRLTNFTQDGKILNFTPNNADAVYNFHAMYTDEEGKSWEQTFKGKTLAKNFVVSISHTDQVVREFSPIGFEVKQMKIGSLIAADSDLTEGEIQDIKWNLNGVYQNSGRVLSIPKGLALGNYVAEAYCSMSNGFGVKAKKEEDDWHFEVKRNDVVDIQSDTLLKVGKKVLFTANSFVFKDLLSNEKVNWTLNGKSVANSVAINSTPSSPGNVTVIAKINAEKGITKSFKVVQPVLENVMFTDSNGIEIQKSAWGNKVHIWLKEKYLTGEKLKVALYDKGTPVYYFPEKVYEGGLLDLELNDELRKHTKDYAELKVMINSVDLNFPKEGELMGMLEVGFVRGVYAGQIGSEDGKQRHTPVDYDMVSWFYAKSRGIKETEKVRIEVYEANSFVLNILFPDTPLLSGEVAPDKSGAIKLKIDWGKIPKEKQSNFKNVYVKVLDTVKDKAELYSGKSFTTRNIVPLIAKSEVNKLAGYSSAAVVGSTSLGEDNNLSTCFCKQEENQFHWSSSLTCEQRKKVLEVSATIWGKDKMKEKASELMSVMHLETSNTFSPAADNGVGYSGLIQFSDDVAKSIGTTRSELKKMTFVQQMDYVKKYLEMKKGQLNSMTDLYLMVIKPNAVGQGNNPDFVLFDESISVPDGDGSKTSTKQRLINIQREPWVTKYGYASNPSFMMEGGEKTKRNKWVYTRQNYELRPGFVNGKTTVKEVAKVLKSDHYDKGKVNIFNGECKNVKEGKKEGKKGRAPWMELAIETAKQMKGCTEDKNPMYDNAKKYLLYCGNTFEPTDSEDGPWCAAFMNWTIGQKKYSNAKSAASLAPLDAKLGKKYKKIDKPVYGCIVVYKHKSKWKGHTGFLYGMTKSGRYILIGGNQDNTIRFDDYGEYTSSSKNKKLYGFYIPSDYEITENDYLSEDDSYETSNEINIKYGIVAVNSTGKTN